MSVPSGISVTGVYVSVGSTPSGTQPQRTLLAGQMLSAGEATANTLHQLTSEAEAIRLGGQWSMLHDMYRTYAANDPAADVWALALADASSGAPAAQTRTVTVGVTAAVAGTLALWVAGVLVETAVSDGDTGSEIATALAAAVTAKTGMSVTAGAASEVVTLTARHAGVAAAEWGVTVATDVGIPLPGGVSVVIADATAGAADPTLDTAIANLGDEPFACIVTPWKASTPLGAIRTEVDRRWGATGGGTYGIILAARRGTVSAAISAHATNDPNLSVMTFPTANTTPTWKLAAAYAGAAMASMRGEPSRPVHRLEMRGIQATPHGSAYTWTERNSAGNNGIAHAYRPPGAQRDTIGGSTTQSLTIDGSADKTFRRIEARYTTARYAQAIAARLGADFARSILLADGEEPDAGVNAATRDEIRASCIAEHETRRRLAWVSGEIDPDVALDVDEPGRVNIQIQPILAGQATVLAVEAKFSALTGG